MSITTPKGYIPLGEAITRLGQNLSDEWTGEEFAPEFATMANINRDTQDYLIGWVAARCINVESTSNLLKSRTKKNPNDGTPLSVSANKQWDRAEETYEIARSLINEIAQFESIKNGGGHLAKIWNNPEREIVCEWPENFPLSKDDLGALKAEDEDFRAPREAAYKRLDQVVRLLQQELCGTPPDCEDAIPALWRYPDKMPNRIDPASWIGLAGLNRLKRAARDDHPKPGRSRITVPLERIEKLCASLATPAKKTVKAEGDCKEWLRALVAKWRKKPDSAVPRKPDLCEQACDEFPGISARAFNDRIWPEIAPPEWKRRGPKSSKGTNR